MKVLMTSLVFVLATACTTVGTTSTVAKDEASQDKSGEEEGLRQERQHALLEALGHSAN